LKNDANPGLDEFEDAMKRLARTVHEHLEKAKASAFSAVEIYNKPGISFRTRSYVIFYRNKTKPWYIDKGSGKGVRYKKS
jgi:hypothetical protein